MKEISSTGEIHIEDFPQNTTVQVSRNFLSKVICKRKMLFKSWKSFYDALNCNQSFSYFKSSFKYSFRDARPLSIFVSTCRKLNIDLDELESAIVAYSLARSRITISNPKLPIQVTPLFSMIASHAMADGGLNRFKDKETVYLNYTQYNQHLRKLFVAKSEAIFGKIEYGRNYIEQSIRVYLPEVITLIVMHYFDLKDDSFLENKSEIPEKIFGLGDKHLLACLIAFIIDEGNIDSGQIVIGLNNKTLIEQLALICNRLNYKYTVSLRKPTGYSLYILREGITAFWGDYLELKREYPEIDMGYKHTALKNIFTRLTKNWKSKGQNQTKNLIIRLLREKPTTVNELAKKLMITRQGGRYHFQSLEKAGIIKKKGKAKYDAILYSLSEYVQFFESNKGASRPYNSTSSKIKKFLKERPLTTIQLAERVKLRRNSLINYLYMLERKNKIKRVGNVKLTTHPTILWQNM